MSFSNIHKFGLVLALFASGTSSVYAHDPIFGIGPHVLFKDGFEAALEVDSAKTGDAKRQGIGLEMTYGLTGDWAAGVDLPYEFKEFSGKNSSGKSDIAVFTKYRFWREDSLGLQESAAVFLKVITDSADKNKSPDLNKGTTDTILGLTYGSEGRKKYRWASSRYRFNGTNSAGIERGDKILLDLVAGIRPTATGYLEPDTVWLVELNGEIGQRSKQFGVELSNSGGIEWFISPGLIWTLRNFAIKAGVQIPVYQNLNGNQATSDYRAKMSFEWHL
ncbi:secreted protein [hydrothermal vent metagenome]|uniref:Secreted protein n=1 Tax=hydrothermal vent metagenome TaxID=652676 RepID=A0A3B1AQ86_9ZZZZ